MLTVRTGVVCGKQLLQEFLGMLNVILHEYIFYKVLFQIIKRVRVYIPIYIICLKYIIEPVLNTPVL